MHSHQLVAQLEALQQAEQFAAGFEDAATQQPAANDLLLKLRTQIHVTLIALDTLRVQMACRVANGSLNDWATQKLFVVAPDQPDAAAPAQPQAPGGAAMSTPNKLHSTLQSAAEFIANSDSADEMRQKLASLLVRDLNEHIAATEKLLQCEAERTGFWGGGADPTVRPTSLQELLDKASEHIWLAERNLDRLRDEGKDSPIWNHWYGRQCGLITLLQLCGALPIGPRHRASDVFHRKLVSLRPQLPDGFELFSVGQALELFMKHGIEATAYEVPYLQRHLVAGLGKHKDVVLPGIGSPGVLDDETLTVTADFDNGSSKHQASVEPVASKANCGDVQASVPPATNDRGVA